jgi:tRNA G18 (ribose-2'-O)-methylase SpoU
MLNIQHVASLDLDELAPYRTLRRPQDHLQQGIFVAEGEKVVKRLVDSSGLTVISMLMTPKWYQLLVADLQKSIAPKVTIYVAEKELLQTIVGFPLHQGIMAVARVPETPPLRDVFTVASTPYLLVALDGLVNAENVGVIVRNSGAFGVDAILVGENCSSPYLRRAVRSSMGAVFALPIIHTSDLAGSLKELDEKRNIRVVLANPSDGIPLEEADLTGNLCIVFGNEGAGLSKEVLNMPMMRVAIPMKSSTDSLNVASASAVLLYKASRQKKAVKKSDLIDTASWSSDPS